MTNTMGNKHHCEGELPQDGYGEAITECLENESGQLWVSNGEYASQVNFCPYCGFKAPHPLDLTIGAIKEGD